MTISKSLASVVGVVGLTAGVNAWWHVSCSNQGPLVTERIDPIVSPGVIGTNHAHTVQGGNAFAQTVTYDQLRAATCSNCETFPQDKSNYWYPSLYFKDPVTGHYDLVPNGGLLVYYEDRGNQDANNGGPGLQAFPAGFRMVTGSASLRSFNETPLAGTQDELSQRAVMWACLRDGAPGYDSTWDWSTVSKPTSANWHGFPHSDCENGFRAEYQFQSCWDGVNVDSPDHASHVAYMTGLDNGACPSTHPVGLMHLFYEVSWDVHSFVTSGRWNPNTTPWPFVYSTGDPTGFSGHADFLNGWDVNAFQDAIETCNNNNNPQFAAGNEAACPFFTLQTGAPENNCKVASLINEAITGNLTRLPGCNPIQKGPGAATLYSTSNCPTNIPF